MSAEFEAHGREEALAERMLLAGAEASEKRRRQNVGGHRLLDRGVDGPAPFSRILDVTREARERLILGEGDGGQVEQPRGDDAAAPPDLGDVGKVELIAPLL